MSSIGSEMSPMNAAENGGGDNGNTNATVVSSRPHSNGSGVGDAGQPGVNSNGNNTISAAADSSDNQPGTPQPPTNSQLIGNNEQQQQLGHNPYAMYTTAATTTNGSVALPHMYGGSIYAMAGGQPDMQQQQQQQQQQPLFSNYMSAMDQIFHPPLPHQQLDYGLLFGAGVHSASGSGRHDPYLNAPTSCAPTDGSQRNGTPENNTNGVANSVALALAQSSAAVSTTTNSLSPRIVSSSSPTSTSTHMQLSGGSATGSPGGNCKLQCKKCGLMCANDNELHEHITNVHGASPYGSSGYSSSPYVKEELSSGSQQQCTAQQGGQGGNPGELLDLDSQKMIYPPAPGRMQSLLHHPNQMHDPVGGSDPLHSMHNMQQRALPGWEQPQPPNNGMQEGMPTYMQQQQPTQPQTGQQQQADLSGKPPHANQSPYYSPKQSPYDVPGSMPNSAGGNSIKDDYGLIKTDYADSQNYVDKSFDPTVTADICQQTSPSVQQQQQMMPVSSSPAEFPSTTTGPQDPQQQYRGFEPPTSSSVNTVSLPTKAATWKSNEPRRPKTYNCTACNKWFTSSGHLKRHYNTTLHKNAVKSSGQPDPATLPISAHHHPARDPTTTTKAHSRRNNASAAAAKQPPAPVQAPKRPKGSPDFAQGAGMGMSQYSASSSPTQVQMNGLPYGANPGGYQSQQQQQPQTQYLNQVQSSTNSHSPSHINVPGISPNNTQTVLNGHPNGLAGPSTPVTPQPMPSSHTRGLLNKTTTSTITKSEFLEDNYPYNNSTVHIIRSPELEAELAKDQGLGSTLSLELSLEPSHMDMEMLHRHHQQRMEAEAAATAAVAAERAQEAEAQLQRHRRARADLEEEELVSFHHHLLQNLERKQRRYHSNTPTYNQVSEHNMQPLSPHITSHQPYHQEQVRRPLGIADSIFSPMPPAAATMPANIMEAPYNILPLGISTPSLLSSSMQLLQQQPPITNTSTTTIVNMDNIHMLHNHHRHHTQEAVQERQEQLVLPSMRSMLLNNTRIQSQADRINSTTQQLLPPITTTTQPLQPQQQLHTTNTMPSYQQLQQESELAPLEPTVTYHTIIGNETILSSGEEGDAFASDSSGHSDSGEYIQLSTLDPFSTLQQQQMFTADSQILQFMSPPLIGQSLYAIPPRTTKYVSYPRSPQEGDLPPAHTLMSNGMQVLDQLYLQQGARLLHSVAVAPKVDLDKSIKIDGDIIIPIHDETVYVIADSSTGSDNGSADTTENTKGAEIKTIKTVQPRKPARRQAASKRQKPPIKYTTTPRSITLPNGRVKCIDCNKTFSKKCYLTQHNNSFHRGEYPYRCVICGKRFQCKDKYETHCLRHIVENKPRKCTDCERQFFHKTDLGRHFISLHTDIKLHTCPVCDKSFCRNDHLLKHIETHSRPRAAAKNLVKKYGRSKQQNPNRPYENQPNTNNVALGQCTEPKQTERQENVAQECNVDIKTDDVMMLPPVCATPSRYATSTIVSGALDVLLNSTNHSYLNDTHLIETDNHLVNYNNSYIVKEEECANGMPYVSALLENNCRHSFDQI